jgi:hypothetical protein
MKKMGIERKSKQIHFQENKAMIIKQGQGYLVSDSKFVEDNK